MGCRIKEIRRGMRRSLWIIQKGVSKEWVTEELINNIWYFPSWVWSPLRSRYRSWINWEHEISFVTDETDWGAAWVSVPPLSSKTLAFTDWNLLIELKAKAAVAVLLCLSNGKFPTGEKEVHHNGGFLKNREPNKLRHSHPVSWPRLINIHKSFSSRGHKNGEERPVFSL